MAPRAYLLTCCIRRWAGASLGSRKPEAGEPVREAHQVAGNLGVFGAEPASFRSWEEEAPRSQMETSRKFPTTDNSRRANRFGEELSLGEGLTDSGSVTARMLQNWVLIAVCPFV